MAGQGTLGFNGRREISQDRGLGCVMGEGNALVGRE